MSELPAPIAPKSCGWQITVADEVVAAQTGLEREYAIADAFGAGTHVPTIMIWRAEPALIVARSQTLWPGFAAAAATLAATGWPVVVRRSGGGAFPIGPGTVEIAMIAEYPVLGASIDSVYDRLGAVIATALADFGIGARAGKTSGAFCDGGHDLIVAGRKIAGLAQHWRSCGGAGRCVTAGASVLVDADLAELSQVVDHFHALCGQTIKIRSDAMTTLRAECRRPPQGDLTAAFAARLAAAAGGPAAAPSTRKIPAPSSAYRSASCRG